MTKFFTKIAAVALTASLLLTGAVASAKGPGGGGGSFGGGGAVHQPSPVIASRPVSNFQSSNLQSSNFQATNTFSANKTTTSNVLSKTGNTGIAGNGLNTLGGQNTLKATNPIVNKPVTMTSNDLKSKGLDIHNTALVNNLHLTNGVKDLKEGMVGGTFKNECKKDFCKDECKPCHDKCWWNYGCNSSWFGCYTTPCCTTPCCSDPWWYTCSQPVTEVIVEQPVILDVTVVQPVAAQPVVGQAVVDPNAAQPVAGGPMQQALQGLGEDQAPAADQVPAAE